MNNDDSTRVTGKNFADKLTPAPPTPCTFDWTPKSINSNKSDQASQAVGFTFTNTNSAPAKLDYIQISFQSGNEASCLFWDSAQYVELTTTGTPANGQIVLIKSNSAVQAVLNIVNHDSDVQTNVSQTDVSISGPAVKDATTGLVSTILTLEPNESLEVWAYGKVWSDQEVDCFVSVQQGWGGDSETDDYTVHKSKGT